MSENGQSSNVGRIVEIKGVVIDAVFSSGLPAIYNALEISLPDGGRLVAEVQQHLGDGRVRAIAMDATDGLARGIDVIDTGGPITVPVGERDARADLQRARRAGRQGRPGRGRASAGRSTASRRRSTA